MCLAIRAIGYSNFTARALWEYAGGGHLGVLVFAKCALCFRGDDDGSPESIICASSLGIRAPLDIVQLKDVILGALLGLPSQDVAFAKCEDAEDGSIGIDVRNAALMTHRAKLAAGAQQCELLELLLAYPWALESGAYLRLPALVEFVVALVDCSTSNRALTRQVDSWKNKLSTHTQELWSIISLLCRFVPFASKKRLVRSCATLAYYRPPQPSATSSFLEGVLSNQCEPLDAQMIIRLVSFASNAGCAPGENILSEAMNSLPVATKRRAQVLLVTSPQRSLRTGDVFESWLQHLNAPAAPKAGEVPLDDSDDDSDDEDCISQTGAEPSERAQTEPLDEEVASPGLPSLRDLVISDAPQELRCAFDGRLLVDPVRSPCGHVFERTVLARALKQTGGFCPLTGAALKLSDCSRDSELRLLIVKWVRQNQPRQRRRDD
eukprot:TRINITY_DN17911_c0_g1_i1.p1 TRINITY_DN17911_c0_g1~~TRINITY_DN17911_c0_g1_i1.p1  ORF type:complete len:436 (-),score=49.61 TRINITY_DN17911_c0_g1_i1:109-1416(-)